MVFGGNKSRPGVVQCYDEEGGLMESRLESTGIPKKMSQGSARVWRNKLYAVGLNMKEDIWKWRLHAFDGLGWVCE